MSSRPAPRPGLLAPSPAMLAGVGALAAALVVALLGFGLGSLPGLAALAVVAPAALVAVLAWAPQLVAVITPALMPLGQVGPLFPFELAFVGFAFVILLDGVLRRRAWMFELHPIERWNLAFVGWAIFTGFWCGDATWYVLGARRLLLGWASFWVAYRAARMIARPVWEWGLLACSAALAFSALGKHATFGFGRERLMLDRAQATDLGWGTANFIATLLLLMTPWLVVIAWRARPAARLASWLTLGAVAVLQLLIASRAATMLFLGGLLVQVAGRSRRRWFAVFALALVLGGLMASPLGEGVLQRFQNPRDLGSMVVRLWYWREAWHRTMDHFPWGIGLDQGFVYPDHLQNIDPHDYWLAVSSELGLPGLLLWIGVLVAVWRGLRALGRDPAWTTEARALKIAFWTSQLHTLVEPTFQGVQYQYLYFWVMGAMLGLARAPRGPSASNAR